MTIPRIDSISQSIAISGFTDGGRREGYIDLTSRIPAGSFVTGWKADITTRFTGGTNSRIELTVGDVADPSAYSSAGWQRVDGGAPNVMGDTTDQFLPLQGTVRVWVRALFDFGSVVGGALDIEVYFLRTVAR